jgi:ABC-2 type transport system ATP-binding protein
VSAAPVAAGERAPDAAVVAEELEFAYGDRKALAGVNFEVGAGEIFGVLGPNGGGKTTLFKILSTSLRPASGRATVLGYDLAGDRTPVRERIGVVFQHPSLDGKLSVRENVYHHGRLFGLGGKELRGRIDSALSRLGIADRAGDRVETLSGGLQRRAELAKGLLSRPELLILDEPSTGLDPGARRDLWRYLRELREAENTTILVTTHLMDEAEHCDRLVILDSGTVICGGTPDELKARIGGSVVTVRSATPEELAPKIAEQVGETPDLVGDELRLEREDGPTVVKQLVEVLGDEIESISLTKPSLEDVFVHETGHRFWNES